MMSYDSDGKMKRYNNFLILLVLLPIFGVLQPTLSAEEISLPAGTRVSLQLNNVLSTKTNKDGDSFTAVVVRPVYSGSRVVIPKGSVVEGSVSRVLRPGRFKGKAILELMFKSINLPGQKQVSIAATLVRIDAGQNSGAQPEGRVKGENSGGGTAKVPASDLANSLTGGGISIGMGTSAGLTSVFTSMGEDLEINRGAAMEIQLDRRLTLP